MNFLNLSNGLLFAHCLLPGWQVVRIRSTHIERNDWESIFADLDHNLLFHLSQGEECRIFDCGTRRKLSKTISLGVPVIKMILEKVWLNKEIEEKNELINGVFNKLIARSITRIAQRAKEKVLYYKKILQTEEVHLIGYSEATEEDGNFSLFREILREASERKERG